MDQCTKCYSSLRTCSDCNGQTNTGFGAHPLTCSTCRSTGQVCPTHGGFWE